MNCKSQRDNHGLSILFFSFLFLCVWPLSLFRVIWLAQYLQKISTVLKFRICSYVLLLFFQDQILARFTMSRKLVLFAVTIKLYIIISILKGKNSKHFLFKDFNKHKLIKNTYSLLILFLLFSHLYKSNTSHLRCIRFNYIMHLEMMIMMTMIWIYQIQDTVPII